MNKSLPLLLSLLLLGLIAACSPSEAGKAERRQDFTADWTFRLGDDTLAARPDYDDSTWRRLNLPHDWAIEGDFSQDNPSGTGGGALPGGIGWYRKTFTVPQSDQGKRLRIDFDGAYMNATVYINGHRLGTRPYGYISFSYDLTPYIQWGAKNVLAVRVDNAEQPNSRWYSGCGIYRNVWLTRTNPVHVARWGTYVTTDTVAADHAQLTVRTTVENSSEQPAQLQLVTELLDADGRFVSSALSLMEVSAGKESEISQELTVDEPQLWTLDVPYLYTVRTTLKERTTGEVLDVYDTPTGIRTFRFDPATGFTLNGVPTKINGVCQHHDLGCLGAAVNTRAIERQLEILKEMGCNGIRCAHNPPAPELLDLCDRMGFIVMDETFDMWRKKKTSHDYARYFNEWHERDLTDLVVRDRNHPSIFIWSIGNEVLEQWSDANADTLSLEEANMILNFGHGKEMLAQEGAELSVNSLLTKKLADMVRALDPTRPVTAGCNEPDPGNHLFRSGALDLIGFNYHDDWFAGVPKNFPGKPFIVTESVSALMTRGYYRMPSDSVVICPERWDKPYHDPSFACSSYDNCHVPWGNRHEGTLALVEQNDFISGQYIWTGFDYIGEPTPYGWPARSSYFGIIDLAGFPKDVYYMYQSHWRPDKQVLHLFPHWNWQEGEEVDLWAYYNNADEVELFVNGKKQSQGPLNSPRGGAKDSRASGSSQEGAKNSRASDSNSEKTARTASSPSGGVEGAGTLVWRVKYEPGTVKAIARRDGKVVAEQEIRTAGAPARIRLTPDRSTLQADGRDLSFITVEVVDQDGNLCPWAENDIAFSVQGNAFIAGVDNGSPISLERFKADHRKAFYGKCLVVVQNSGKKGNVTLTATAEGLEQETAKITVR